MAEYTPEQRAAFSFVTLERADPGAWRKINAHMLSFTEPEWGPLQQLYGSLSEGFRRLLVIPGETAGLGFAAHANADGSVNAQDAERLRKQFVIFLTPEDAT